MVDGLNKKQRSYNMSQIRSEKTQPEMYLCKMLLNRGIKDFEMHSKKVMGHPDFYFSNRKFALFLDGCFWHGCKKCFRKPTTNTKFWTSKIKTNIQRDDFVNKKLKSQGIVVLRIKEHELKKKMKY